MKRTIVLFALAALFLLAPVVQGWAQRPAPAGADYDLSWWTVDGGGTTRNSGGRYALDATAGQPDAAVWAGDGYALAGGFWPGVPLKYRTYLPWVMK
jgi:hypothetical protein